MRRSRISWLALGLALTLTPAAAMADHRIADQRPTTPYDEFRNMVPDPLRHWIDDPMLEIREGHGALAAFSLSEELRYVVPDGCYLGSYGAWWGLVPTLLAISAGPDIASKDIAIGRFREELARAVLLTEEDAERCALATRVDVEQEGPLASLPPYDSVVELEADATLRFIGEDGESVSAIGVVPGETLLIRVDNTAGFDHSFFIGTSEELSQPMATTDVGIDTWTSGTRELIWTVPDDPSGLLFGCTVPGHFLPAHGRIVLASALQRTQGAE
jgi:hypothetical protein